MLIINSSGFGKDKSGKKELKKKTKADLKAQKEAFAKEEEERLAKIEAENEALKKADALYEKSSSLVKTLEEKGITGKEQGIIEKIGINANVGKIILFSSSIIIISGIIYITWRNRADNKSR